MQLCAPASTAAARAPALALCQAEPAAEAATPALTIIGLCGRAGSGKDRAAEYLCEHYGFVRAAFADSLKRMLEPLLVAADEDYAALYEPALKAVPLPGLHGLSARQLMQTLGDWGRAQHPDFWVQLAMARLGLSPDVAHAQPVHDRIVVTDVRFPNEAAALLQCGAHLVRVEREQAEPLAGPLHASELHVSALPATHVLPNHGISLISLHGSVAALMQDLGLDQAEPVEVEYRLQGL